MILKIISHRSKNTLLTYVYDKTKHIVPPKQLLPQYNAIAMQNYALTYVLYIYSYIHYTIPKPPPNNPSTQHKTQFLEFSYAMITSFLDPLLYNKANLKHSLQITTTHTWAIESLIVITTGVCGPKH